MTTEVKHDPPKYEAPKPDPKKGKAGEEEVWDPHQVNPSEGSINEPLPENEAKHRAVPDEPKKK
jgi:hypothetical protein